MSAPSTSTVSSSLLAAPHELNCWLGLLIWAVGNIGCLGNMLVFSSHYYRQRAYSVYLLAEAVSGVIYFNFLLMTRILQRGFQIPITTRFDALCKVRQFNSVWNPVISMSFFSLAIINRICSLQRAIGKRAATELNPILSLALALSLSYASVSSVGHARRAGLPGVRRLSPVLADLFRSSTRALQRSRRTMCCASGLLCQL